MDAVATTLLHRLLDDRPAASAAPDEVLSTHSAHRSSWYATATGPLIVPDTGLAALARAVPDEADAPLEVKVVTTGGAGSLSALANRSLAGLRVVVAESALRDLDDLAGNAARVVAAAAALDEVEVEVTLPDAPGWVRAVEVVEAAGLWAHLSTGPEAWSDRTAAVRLAERLAVLVEADLAFSLSTTDGEELAEPGRAVAALVMLVEALVDGAEPAEAAELLVLADAARIRAGLERWDAATATRVRRRLRSVGCSPRAVVAGLVDLRLLAAPTVAS